MQQYGISCLYAKSPYIGRLNPKTMQLLMARVESSKTALCSSPLAMIQGNISENCSARADSMWLQLQTMKAVVEHSTCYDGFGGDSSGNFATVGEAEIAALLDDKKEGKSTFRSIINLALSAEQSDFFCWAVCALEECVILLEHQRERIGISSFSGNASPPIALQLRMHLTANRKDLSASKTAAERVMQLLQVTQSVMDVVDERATVSAAHVKRLKKSNLITPLSNGSLWSFPSKAETTRTRRGS